MPKYAWSNLCLVPVAALVHPTFAADYLSVSEAQKVLFPTAARFEQRKVELSSEQLSKIKETSGVRQRNKSPQIWRALSAEKKSLGWFMVDEVIGKHEFITYAVALTPAPEVKVLGMEILSYRETHGGDVRKPEWRKYFKGKNLGDPFKLDEDVPNISGATLSCRNLLDGVKRLLVLQQVIGDS